MRLYAGLRRPDAVRPRAGFPGSTQDLVEMGKRLEKVQRSKQGAEGRPYFFVGDAQAGAGPGPKKKAGSTNRLFELDQTFKLKGEEGDRGSAGHEGLRSPRRR